MNRIMGRARLLLVLVLILALGTSFFVGEYFIGSGKWILFSGSPHVYNAGNIGCGVIADRDGILLLDLRNNRTYAQNETLRSATLHWLGDRKGSISAPALSNYASEMIGFDPIGGVYAYGGVGGQATMTLSATVQMTALEAMGDYKGTVAVYNYKTGEILCAVTTPTYDPDNIPDFTADVNGVYSGVYVNRFIQSAYTPGSIFKIVTVAAALEAMPEIQNQSFTCTGTVEYGVDTVTCEQAHGTLTFQEAFAKSCNCSFAQIAGILGEDVLQRYVSQFGITESLSFDGITTASGNVDLTGAAPVQLAWSAIGQHKDLINPCRYMSFIGAIAAGGTGVKPHLISQIKVGSGVTYQAKPQPNGRIMSSETAAILQEYLRNNVENYYGDDSFPELTVCAKSGTAEVGGEKKPNAMFTGFVADEDYPLAFIAAIEDGGYGRPVCVPILSKVLTACKEAIDNER